jgi:molybdenum cofactor biosynthesis enzyme MoaA
MHERSLNTIDLLKLDCEGAEYEILFSLPDAEFKKVNRIAMETHVTESHKTEDLVDFLRNKGYQVNYIANKETGHIWAWR